MRELRERLERQQKLLEQLQTQLGQQPPEGQLNLQPAPLTPGWMPTRDNERVLESDQSSPKIRNVEALQTTPHDIVVKLRKSWFGSLYTNNFKQYALIRQATRWIWRNGYPLYVNQFASRLTSRKAQQWRPLIKLSEFASQTGTPTYTLADAALVETPPPNVFPSSDQDYLKTPHDRFRFPEIYVATITNAITYGGTNLVLADDKVICHDLYDFNRDFTSEELHGRTLIDPISHRIRWLLHDESPELIPVAATFVDACAPNYAHWMTEVLPRIVLFCREVQFKDVPIIVNEGLHQNIMESLILVAGVDREVITLPIGRALMVNKLYLTSATGYVPFEPRTNKLSGHSHGAFNPNAFEIFRNQLNVVTQKTNNGTWPEKIFLRRNSGARQVTNSAAIEQFLTGKDFTIIEPEKLTFYEQLKLFSNAKIVIGATGAAFSNMIFCASGTYAGILISKHESMPYNYWMNMLFPIGIKVNYVLGEIVENNELGVHGDFEIDLVAVIYFLSVIQINK